MRKVTSVTILSFASLSWSVMMMTMLQQIQWLTSSALPKVMGDEDQMIDQDSIDDSTDFCMHGNDGSPSGVDNNIIEIDDEPAMVSDMPGSSCSDATLVLHGQHEGNNAPSVGPTDIAQSPAFPPVQPVNIQFPKTAFGNRTRSFNPGWYGSYEWLDYSVRLNACFVTHVDYLVHIVVSLAAVMNQLSLLMGLKTGSMQLVPRGFLVAMQIAKVISKL